MNNEMLAGYALGQDSGGGMMNGMGGWEFMWVIILLALFGWGGNGFGGNNGGCKANCATVSDLNYLQLDNGIRGLATGLCDSTYAVTNAVTNGFSSAELSRCNQQAAIMQQLNNMSYQAQDCCCQTQRAIDGVNYNMATGFCNVQNTANNNTRDIIQSTHNDTDRIIAKLAEMETNRLQDKLNSLTAENQSLKFQASQAAQNAFITANQSAQTAELIRRLGADCPIPAYVVPNPNCCNNSCGCGCGC